MATLRGSRARWSSSLTAARMFCLGIMGFLVTSCGADAPSSQEKATGFLDRDMGSQVEGGAYQLYVPRDFDFQRSWPLVVYLHGGGAGGSDGLRPTEGGLASAIRINPEWFPTLVLFPQAPANTLWEGDVADQVLLQIEATIAEYPVDPDRVYLTGASMGGQGVYYLAARYPIRFAGLVVSCGSPITPPWRLEELGLPPIERTSEVFDEVARALEGLPLRAFHGSEDAVVDVGEARAMIGALEATGADATLTEYQGFGHNACFRAFFEEGLWPWLFAQRRSSN